MVFKIPFNVYKTLFCDHRDTSSKVSRHFLISWPAQCIQPSCPVITCLWTSLLMRLHPRFLFPFSFTYVSRHCLWNKPPAPKPWSQDLLWGDIWAHTTSSSREWQLWSPGSWGMVSVSPLACFFFCCPLICFCTPRLPSCCALEEMLPFKSTDQLV